MNEDIEKSLSEAFHILSMYYNQEAYVQALEYALRIKNKYESQLDPTHDMLFELYMKLSTLYGLNGMHADQLETCLKASKMFSEQIKASKEKEIEFYTNMAKAHSDLHYFPEGLPWAKRAIELLEANPECNTDNRSIQIHNLIADLLRQTGQDELAIEYYQKTIEIYTRVFGRKYGAITYCYRNIARIYFRRGKYDKSLAWLLKAQALIDKLPHRDCYSQALIHSALALQYEVVGQSSKATECLNKMKAAFESESKLSTHSRTQLASNICDILMLKKEPKQALEWQQKAVSMAEKYFKKEHPATAIEYTSLGHVYETMKNYNMAIKNYIKAFTLRKSLFGIEHEATLNCLARIGSCYSKAKNYIKGEEVLLEAIRAEEKFYGEEESPLMLHTYLPLAINYSEREMNEQAEIYFRKALLLYEKFPDQITDQYPETLHIVMNFYLRTAKYDIALEYAIKRYEILRKTFGKENNRTLYAACNMAECYSALNEHDKAIELYIQVMRSFTSRYGLQSEHCQTVFSDLHTAHKLAGIEEDFSQWLIPYIKDIPLHKINRKRKK